MSNQQRSRGALLSLISLVGSLLVAEGVLRTRPTPRIQSVSPNQADLTVRDGEISWRSRSRGEREQVDCVAEKGGAEKGGAEKGGAEIVILGSSILFGVQLDYPDTLGAHLSKSVDGCVVNLAQPASSFATQAATAQHALPDLSPSVVIWEIWQNSPNQFAMVGASAYNFGNLAVDAGGVPSPFGLPVGLNRALFGHSALYRFAVLTQATEATGSQTGSNLWGTFSGAALDRLTELTGPAKLILPMMPPLSASFAQTAARPPPGYAIFRAEAKRRGIATLDIAAALTTHDHEALRLDPCCHLNAAGQEVLAAVLAEEVARVLSDRPDPEPSEALP
ncbi:MAG: hypothetical protein ACI8RZ_005266 [Myxococcota bacterium]|jgi:hypothetical protein